MPLRPSPSPTRTQPSLLPMAGQTHGNRSALTCHLRCGDACSKVAPNTTEISKSVESREKPQEGDNHSYSTTAPVTPQKAEGASATNMERK